MRRPSAALTPVAALESRQLLSGNVQFQFDGATLRLTGDNSSNSITISQSSGGMVIAAQSGTKLSGVTNGTQTIANPSEIIIDLKGGNDTLGLDGFLGSKVTIQLGSGNDKLNGNSMVCDGAFLVDLGSGNDLLNAQGTQETPNQFGASLTVKGNSGNDKMIIHHVVANGQVTFDAGSGNDALALSNGLFNDSVQLEMGAGNDLLGIALSRFNSIASTLGNTGNDILGIIGNRFVISPVYDMGDGKDGLLSQDNQFDADVSRIGGKDADIGYSSNDFIAGTESVTGFETLATTLTPQVISLLNKAAAVLPA